MSWCLYSYVRVFLHPLFLLDWIVSNIETRIPVITKRFRVSETGDRIIIQRILTQIGKLELSSKEDTQDIISGIGVIPWEKERL